MKVLLKMNKKLITTVVVAITVLAVATGAAIYFLSFRTVSFVLKKPDITATVFSADDKEQKNKLVELRQNGTLRLQEGNYAIVPSGNYDTTPIYFSVKDRDMTVEVDPSLSEEYLAEKLSEELPAINSALRAALGATLSDFDINEGKLYKEGQWYATSLAQKSPGPGSQGDVYHAVLYKKDDTWTLIGKPQIVLTKYNVANVPVDILQDANRLGE
jgi:flagellar basal body-associated protein FliL